MTVLPRRPDRGMRSDRGASLVEYGLGVALIVVASLVAMNFLSTSAADQAAKESDCISSRPPPASCVRTPVPGVTTPTSTAVPPTSTTLTPPSTDPPPTTAPPPQSSLTAGVATLTVRGDGTWVISAPVTVKDRADAPVAGAVVTARIILGRQPILVECTTDAAGTCALVVDPIPTDVTSATLTVVAVVSNPPAASGSFPHWDVTKP